MDESKEYQEMCKALPEEIVKEFETIIGTINDVGSVAVLDNGEVGYIGTNLGGWQVHGYDCSAADTPITRLYTQDQLQKILSTSIRETLFYMPSLMNEWAKTEDRNMTMDQLWLLIVMKRLHAMSWDKIGQKWV